MPKDPTDNVIDLTSRRLARTDHIEIRYNPARRLVEQRFKSREHGTVVADLTLPAVVELIEGLFREGARLGTAEWTRWAGHVGSVAGGTDGAARAWAFAQAWRQVRPKRGAPEGQRGVVVAALNAALDLTREPSGEGFGPDAEAQVWIAHLAYQGEPLAAFTCGVEPCQHVIDWDSL